MTHRPESPRCTMLYDGGCPVCSGFAALTSEASVTKLDARAASDLKTRALVAGLDLDRGIVVDDGTQLHFGPAALTWLARRPGQRLRLRLAYLPFHSARGARLLYPVLVAMRNVLLRLPGTPRIGAAAPGEWADWPGDGG